MYLKDELQAAGALLEAGGGVTGWCWQCYEGDWYAICDRCGILLDYHGFDREEQARDMLNEHRCPR